LNFELLSNVRPGNKAKLKCGKNLYTPKWQNSDCSDRLTAFCDWV